MNRERHHVGLYAAAARREQAHASQKLHASAGSALELPAVGLGVSGLTENFAVADINLGLLYLFAISSLGVYGIIMSGWLGAINYGVIVANDVDSFLMKSAKSDGSCLQTAPTQ